MLRDTYVNGYDSIIIGGGFYGLRIAQFLREELGQKRVLVIEKESDVMKRASYNNQARIHNGYHYPRSVLTALRSRVNLPVFAGEYHEAIVNDFDKYYAVARNFSKVNSIQYERFFERIGADISKAPEILELFNPNLIEDVFLVKEYAFNADKLRRILLDKLNSIGVEINTGEIAEKISKSGNFLSLKTDKSHYLAGHIINTTYSSINLLNQSSGLDVIPLKHELTEMCLVKVPSEFDGKAFTVMCGPFFSLMPFPAKNTYSLSHVRYTPHSEWYDTNEQVRNGHNYLDLIGRDSHFPQMYADIKRYMPKAEMITYNNESLWEVKTTLPRNESDDSRPILYLDNFGGLRNYICIMGGKLDNVYDVFRELRETYGTT